VGKRSLVSLDTQHIKTYVCETDRLKEIRGASSILDRLNRQEMKRVALQADQEAIEIFANGGSGLYAMRSECVEVFCRSIQDVYKTQTKGRLPIACAVQDLPADLPVDGPELLKVKLKQEFELLRFRLQQEKSHPAEIIALPSYPLMHTCNACGMCYSEGRDTAYDEDEPDEGDTLYCASCLEKRHEDRRVKAALRIRLEPAQRPSAHLRMHSPLWERVLQSLQNAHYALPAGTKRPDDFNDFRQFGTSKGYLGLIYADGNSMGRKMDDFSTLQEWQDFARTVDSAIYTAVCQAIQKHLPVQQFPGQKPLFPFDLLLLGGDDILIVTPADVALDVALTLATQFYEATNKQHTLSIGVILAPVKYPFGLLHTLVEETLRHAKKEGAERRQARKQNVKKLEGPSQKTKLEHNDSLINFLVVTGSTSQSFEKVYDSLCERHGRVSDRENDVAFYATLRPYTVKELDNLLQAIRKGKALGLGHTKLHQLREAVLKMNLTSSVMEGLAVLRNWRPRQRDFVLSQVYTPGKRYQERYKDEDHPETLFPRITFPWFADGPDVYRSSLLDFVELYDFVASKGEHNANG
jgi:hypothetical protein